MNVRVVDGALTRELRRQVLRPHLGPEDVLPGDGIADAIHLAVLDEGDTAIGACYLVPRDCPWRIADVGAWQLRQMATDPSHRGEGAGTGLLQAATRMVAGTLWCYARGPAVPFYLRNGWRSVGELFTDDEHDQPHLRMWLVPAPS